MKGKSVKEILQDLKNGDISLDQAVLALKMEPFEDLVFAKPDYHRALRQGVCEVIYGQGKTKEQIVKICNALRDHGQDGILVTRIGKEVADYMEEFLSVSYSETARLALVGDKAPLSGKGKIVVASGGTSDLPVAEEAFLTAEALGNEVVRLYDVGVAGLHRLLTNLPIIMDAKVIIAVAGMEGALASVIGGLADCPVIACPTSVGYGASFNGLSSLLSMLNSCASGVSVVNIDNGFGAGYMAHLINRP